MVNNFGNIGLEVVKASSFVEKFIDNINACKDVNGKAVMFMDNQEELKKNLNILNTYIATCDDIDDESYNIARNTTIAFNNCLGEYKKEMQINSQGNNIAENVVINNDDIRNVAQDVAEKVEQQKANPANKALSIPNFMCMVNGNVLMFHAENKEEVNSYLDKVVKKYGVAVDGNIPNISLFRAQYTPVQLSEKMVRTVEMK